MVKVVKTITLVEKILELLANYEDSDLSQKLAALEAAGTILQSEGDQIA